MPLASIGQLNAWVKQDTQFNATQRRLEQQGRPFEPPVVRTFTLGCGKVIGSPEGLEARELTIKLQEKQKLADVLKKSNAKIRELQNA